MIDLLVIDNFYTLLFLGGRQPLCGMGVMSIISDTSIPAWLIVLIADSLPPPGPFTYTFTLRSPKSNAALAQSPAAICAAYGVFFFEPRNPILPADDQLITCPASLVREMIKLLNVALT